MQTTLEKIRAHSPCESDWNQMLTFLGKTKADDEPLLLSTVLQSNGLDDTLWCFCAVEGFEREKRLFAVWCVRQVQHLLTDPRSLAAPDVAEKFANGLASAEELGAAWSAAWDAAPDSAWDAARDAAMGAAAWGRPWDAAWAAAWSAARDAARDARDAAMGAARASQIQELKRVLACVEAGIDPYPPQKD